MLDVGTTHYAITNELGEEAFPSSIIVLDYFGLNLGLILVLIFQTIIFTIATHYVITKQRARKIYLVILIIAVLLRTLVVINNFAVCFGGGIKWI